MIKKIVPELYRLLGNASVIHSATDCSVALADQHGNTTVNTLVVWIVKFTISCTDYLPVNPSAMEGTLQPVLGPDGKMKEPESNVLRASIENMQYAVTVDVLHRVRRFSHPSVYI
ncbi:unnamed protein product [Musa acuminata subsp. malaccensis]|uniref:(wild Malaysian banana) hypothetical protein n=1 Tax=Musa acuminata subsp. malaccensis TaxID=214687 RepID=A0A804L5S2_MUSAM|nr:unnamed protein product [Musa acuminata subsp. malaccensis]